MPKRADGGNLNKKYMGRFGFKIARALGRAVSWEVGRAMRVKKGRVKKGALSGQSFLTPVPEPKLDYPPATQKEKDWIESVAVLERRVESLKALRSKEAAIELLLLLNAIGAVITQYNDYFAKTAHSREFMEDFWAKLQAISEDIPHFIGAHLSMADKERVVKKTGEKAQINMQTWVITV